jgi:hypothetical protein
VRAFPEAFNVSLDYIVRSGAPQSRAQRARAEHLKLREIEGERWREW